MLKYKNRTNLHGQFLHFFKIYFLSASGPVLRRIRTGWLEI